MQIIGVMRCRVALSHIHIGPHQFQCWTSGFTVNLMRGQLLTTGPLAVIAVCYAIAAPSSLPGGRMDQLLRPTVRLSAGLNVDCRSNADELSRRLPADWNVLIHEPFVIAGDCPREHLERYHRDTIAPTVRALSVQYFDQHPTWPITIVLCSSDDSYRECNRSLGERDRSEYAGIYSRSEHRVIVNIGTGEGTLAHELTHALAHADFPELPEWLDEGLASLYEECEFSADGLRLVGTENWRGAALVNALRREKLRSVAELASEQFASGDASVDYAQARYFCLFLQKRNLLEAFYRKCRAHSRSSRDGIQSLMELMGTTDLQTIDHQFQTWLGTLKRGG